MIDPAEFNAYCANCQALLAGEYCQVCGQHRAALDDLSVTRIVTRFGHELAHLDFKSLRSLVALLAPGYLTAEYLQGRRRRYLTPLKLYFVVAAVFFVAAPFVGFTLGDLMAQDSTGALSQMVNKRISERQLAPDLFAERFDLRLQTVYTLALAVSVVSAALLLQALYRRRTLGEHLVFALHYVSFLYLGAILLGSYNKVFGWPGPGISLALTYTIIGPYLLAGLRRVYGGGLLRTAAKALLILTVSFVVDNIVNFGALFLTLWLV